MVQNTYQIFLDNSFPIRIEAVFSLLPILQMVLVPVDKSAEFVEPGLIISNNCFLTTSHQKITNTMELFDLWEIA